MATIRGWSMRGNIQRAIDYITNPLKSNPEYVFSTSGNPSVTGMFWDIKNMSIDKANTKSGKEVYSGYHLQMSFPPGEVTEQQCYDIASGWFKRCFGDEYNYVISVHHDKPHIHAHIIFNPVSKKTGITRYIYFKHELNRMKEISDMICRENNLSIVEEPNYKSMNYFEWLKKGDSYKSIISKTLESVIPKVSSYEDLKKYMSALGFEFEDSFDREFKDTFDFTVNERLYLPTKSREGKIAVRVPGTSARIYALLNENDVTFYNDGKALKCSMEIKNLSSVTVYDKSTDEPINWTTEEFIQHFDDKTRKKNQLAIKVPDGKTFIKTSYIQKNEEGQGYTLEDVLKRIQNNGIEKTEEDILNVINSDVKSVEQQRQWKSDFYSKNNIRVPFKESIYGSTKKERYINFRKNEIQKILDDVGELMSYNSKHNSIQELEEEIKTISNEYHIVTKELYTNEKVYRQMITDIMDDTLEMTQEQLDKWVKNNITPLETKRSKLKDAYSDSKYALKRYKELSEHMGSDENKNTVQQKKEEKSEMRNERLKER